jgi:hypothetical protein
MGMSNHYSPNEILEEVSRQLAQGSLRKGAASRRPNRTNTVFLPRVFLDDGETVIEIQTMMASYSHPYKKISSQHHVSKRLERYLRFLILTKFPMN